MNNHECGSTPPIATMKKFIIKLIANQYKKRIAVAKYLRVKHIQYMYTYSYVKLIQTYVKSLTL